MSIEPGWVWAILAVICVLIEALTVSFFFLVWALAAAAVALLWFFVSMAWQWQLLAFVAFSLPLLGLWALLARRWRTQTSADVVVLNQRSAAYVGREFELQTPVKHGVGTLKIGDTLWRIEGENLPAGATIIITAARDNVLSFQHAK